MKETTMEPAVIPAETARPPDTWTSYSRTKIQRKTALKEGENPFHISGSRTDAEAALREAQRWLLPLPDKELRQELVALHLKTIEQKKGDVDVNLMLRIYLDELKAYPGDVVRDQIRAWPKKFFPTWAELKEVIVSDRRIRERRLRIEALAKFLRGEQDEERKGPPPTQAQIDRNRAHFNHERPHVYSEESLKRLEAVDKAHGDKAKAPNGKWKSIGQLVRDNELARPQHTGE